MQWLSMIWRCYIFKEETFIVFDKLCVSCLLELLVFFISSSLEGERFRNGEPGDILVGYFLTDVGFDAIVVIDVFVSEQYHVGDVIPAGVLFLAVFFEVDSFVFKFASFDVAHKTVVFLIVVFLFSCGIRGRKC